MASLSFSQSLSNSLIERRLKHHPNHGKNKEPQRDGYDADDGEGGPDLVTESSKTGQDIGVFKQFILTFVSFGYSCSIEFEAIYGVVSMQYFGLPLSLVSLPGLISGIVNSFFVPLLGHYSDHGPNPLKRKLTALVYTTFCLLVGYTILGACSWVKLVEMDGNIRYSNDTNLSNINDTNNWNKTSSSSNVSNGSEVSTPIIGILSVLPFILFDTGYDSCVVMSRASVLDVISAQHRNSILTMAGMMTGFAGITVGALGIMDFPTIFGSAFEIDGFALTLILLSAFFALCGVMSSLCSVMTIWKLHCNNTSTNMTDNVYHNSITSVKQNGFSRKSYQTDSYQDSMNSFTIMSRNQVYDTKGKNSSSTSLSSLSIENTSKSFLLPSLEKQRTPSMGYRSFVSNVENSSSSNLRDQTAVIPESENNYITRIPSSSQNIDDIYRVSIDNEGGYLNTISSNSENKSSGKSPFLSISKSYEKDCGNFNTIFYASENKLSETSLRLSDSKSYETALGQINLQKLRENKRNQTQQANKLPSKSSLCNTRLLVCIFGIVLCGQAVTATTMYHSYTLTIEVFKGDPMALPGSPGRILYEAAIRMSSFGALTAYASYFCFNIASPKLIDRFGALKVFITSNFLVIVSSSIYCAYPRLETYFTMMILYGVNKAVLLGVAYILAIFYSPLHCVDDPEKLTSDGEHPSSSSSNVMGQLMALVSLTVPIGYIVVSSVMGPWMDAVGSARPPIHFNIGSAFGAVITGLGLSYL